MLKERAMDDPCSVNSPRRVLSLSRKRKETLLFPELDDQASGFGVSAIFLIWAYAPDRWLHTIGIFYYPSRYWALAVPTYAMAIVVLAIGFYIGLNFMATPPPTSLNTMFDEYGREPLRSEPSVKGTSSPLSPYLILASTKSMILCSTFRNDNLSLHDDPPVHVLIALRNYHYAFGELTLMPVENCSK